MAPLGADGGPHARSVDGEVIQVACLLEVDSNNDVLLGKVDLLMGVDVCRLLRMDE